MLYSFGGVLSLLSLVIIAKAQADMGDFWRVGIDEKVKTELVTKGIFRYVRNPTFSGIIVLLTGIFLIISEPAVLFLLFLTFLFFEIQVRCEEEFLSRVHGEKYEVYFKLTGRYLPKITRKSKIK